MGKCTLFSNTCLLSIWGLIFPYYIPIYLDDCVTKSGAECDFPFIYHGVEYNFCTGIDHNKLWCASTGAGAKCMDCWGNETAFIWENCDEEKCVGGKYIVGWKWKNNCTFFHILAHCEV